MLTALKKILIAVAVIAISAGIFMLVVQDQEVKGDVLRASLDLFGERLLGMVPEGENKAELEKRYNEFLAKAEKDEVPEQEIEKVAANILNLANQEEEIDAEQAMFVFNVVTVEESEPECDLEEETEESKLSEHKPLHKRGPILLPRPRRTIDRERLADKLRHMHEFQIQIRELQDKNLCDATDIWQKYMFVADSGLKIAMNVDFKNMLEQKEFQKVQEKLSELERQHLVSWSKDFQRQMHKQMIHLRNQMEQLKNLPVDASAKEGESWGEAFGDSIATNVIKGLQEAGIIPDTCEANE